MSDKEPFRYSATLFYSISGFVLGVAAPLGALVLRALVIGVDSISEELDENRFFYVYQLIGTSFVFSMAGFVAGRRIDRLRDRKAHYRWLSERDDLTSLANARGFRDRLSRSAERALRLGEPLALLLIDVDGLKAINDDLGHPFGSQALQHVANLVVECKRQEDFAARWGGDELAIIMSGADASAGKRVGQAILDKTRDQPLLYRGKRRIVTVTIGIAAASPPSSADWLFSAADTALYEGKMRGRNQVRISDVPFEQPEPTEEQLPG